jgi:hypothetical protein
MGAPPQGECARNKSNTDPRFGVNPGAETRHGKKDDARQIIEDHPRRRRESS